MASSDQSAAPQDGLPATLAEAPAHLQQSYLEADYRHRLSHLTIACVLAITIVPGGVFLDASVYPDAVWQLAAIRGINVLGLLVLLGLLRTGPSQQAVKWLGVGWAYLMCASLAAMCFSTGGYQSTYYAGINLVILALGVLLPFSLRETLIVCLGSYGLWLAGIAPSLWQAESVQTVLPQVINSSFFIGATSAICVTASHFTSRARFRDFVLRQTLDDQNRQLAELDELKTDFFANISHELRTPLTLIIAPIEQMLNRSQLPDDTRDSLQLVRANALRLLSLINDLLEIVKLDHGKLEPDQQPVDLSMYLSATAESMRPLIEAKDIRFVVEPDQTPAVQSATVSIDRDQIDKVLLNLLSNAAKFTPPNGRITLAWTVAEDQAVITVQDTGIGIPPEDLPRIFDRFRQVDGSASRQFQGVGLGLALARELAEAHEGSLTVSSELDAGTCFTLRLPRCAERPDIGQAKEPLPSDPIARAMKEADRHTLHLLAQNSLPASESDDATDSPRPGLLLVDDEPQIIHYLQTLFTAEYDTRTATNGEAGLAAVAEWTPDLVICDMMMPGLTGIEFAKALRQEERFASTKIVMLTARADDRTKMEALECGIDDFMPKPFSATEITTRMRNLYRTVELQNNLKTRNQELQDTLEQLGRTEAQLLQSEKMNALGSLSAGLLHEINNPLNFTLAAVQIMQESLPDQDEDNREMLTDVEEGMKRIRDIICDLRAFAYPEERKPSEQFSLRQAVQQAMRFTAHECQDVEIVNETQDLHVIDGSPTHITQLLVNVLVNAAKATLPVKAERKPEIRIAADWQDNRLHIRIADNGVGITDTDRQRVFEPFFTTRSVGDGIGLGLSICHTIVTNHGGTIAATTNNPHGTIIAFDLPAGANRGQYAAIS